MNEALSGVSEKLRVVYTEKWKAGTGLGNAMLNLCAELFEKTWKLVAGHKVRWCWLLLQLSCIQKIRVPTGNSIKTDPTF